MIDAVCALICPFSTIWKRKIGLVIAHFSNTERHGILFSMTKGRGSVTSWSSYITHASNWHDESGTPPDEEGFAKFHVNTELSLSSTGGPDGYSQHGNVCRAVLGLYHSTDAQHTEHAFWSYPARSGKLSNHYLFITRGYIAPNAATREIRESFSPHTRSRSSRPCRKQSKTVVVVGGLKLKEKKKDYC